MFCPPQCPFLPTTNNISAFRVVEVGSLISLTLGYRHCLPLRLNVVADLVLTEILPIFQNDPNLCRRDSHSIYYLLQIKISLDLVVNITKRLQVTRRKYQVRPQLFFRHEQLLLVLGL